MQMKIKMIIKVKKEIIYVYIYFTRKTIYFLVFSLTTPC